jgi:ferredoxin
MPKQINDKCIRCGICLPECPQEGITQVGALYTIDTSMCSDCYGFDEKARCTTLCPVDAVEEAPGPPVSEQELGARAMRMRPDHFPAD